MLADARQPPNEIDVAKPNWFRRHLGSRFGEAMSSVTSAVCETKDARQSRLAAEEALRVAKIASRKRIWFRVRLTLLLIPLMFFGCLLGLTKIVPPSPQGGSYIATPSIRNPPTEFTTPKASEPKVTPPSSSKHRDYQEGTVEKVYEKLTGKEVVHRKDGTTYERNAPKKWK